MEEQRYRVILSSEKTYRDVALTDVLQGTDEQQLLIGTSVHANVRLRVQDFPSPFSFLMKFEYGKWKVLCPQPLYLLAGDLQKTAQKQLQSGDEVTIRYSNTNQKVLTLYFSVDYDYDLKKYDRVIGIESLKNLKIGSGKDCQIRLSPGENQLGTLKIWKNGSQYMLQKAGIGYGVRLNGQSFRGTAELDTFDFFSIGAYSFCFCDEKLYTDSSSDLIYNGVSVCDEKASLSHHNYPKYNRSTRIRNVISTEKIKVLDPPSMPQKPGTNVTVQLFPAIAMLAVILILRVGMDQSRLNFIFMSVCSMGIGIVTSVMSIISERRKYKKDIEKRETSYQEYIEEKRNSIEIRRKEEAQILNDTYYSVARELEMVDGFLPNLFERAVGDQDFLEVNLGNGRREALQEIDYKRQEKVEPLDELQKLPEKLAEEYRMLDDVPVTLKLAEASVIGVSGSRESLYHVMKILTMDLAVRHYYTDVKFVYSIDEKDSRKLKWLRLLPHVQNEMLNRRNIICDEESRNVLLEFLYKELSHRNQKSCMPRIVVFVYRNQGIQSHPISELMYGAKEKGITFIWFHEYQELLPRGCDYIIQMEDLLHGIKIDSRDGTKSEQFMMPVLQDTAFSHAIRRMAPIYCEEISLAGTLTKHISFFEMLNIYQPEDIDLMQNWSNAQVYRTMAAPVGVKGENQIIALDIHEKAHGPHGLVAGTTGSGKSEILQTYILSMALRYHPYEVGFVIIDYKGGGMGKQFRNLPHLIGTITNIDGKQTGRSLMSIQAEMKKRQEIFAEYGVNHIDDYIKLYRKGVTRKPLPHLILIVDEFAELKRDQPEFMKELISAARIGRSIGVHLILATQKPSGVVDPQIWSNSRFRLCLKVQSKEDSNEILKTPLAAEITEPGRAYLQVGSNEIFELFQSAYSGDSAKAEGMASKKKFKISRVSLTGRRTVVYEQRPVKQEEEKETQLVSVVNYISGYCQKAGLKRLPDICLPPLPLVQKAASMRRCENIKDGIKAYTGIYDDPSRQYQGVLTLNVTLENIMIIGSAQNGKTNLLQIIIRSLAEQYSPEELNLYILDFGSGIFRNLEELHHVGGVVCFDEDEKCKNLFKLLNEEMKIRRDRLAETGVSSFASYLEAGFRDLPQIVVVIDNLTAMRERYLMDQDFLLPLCREGLAAGISFVIANSQTSGIGYKYLSNFRQRIALYCNDSTEYSALFESCRMKPMDTPGRCLIENEKNIYEAQTYLAFDGEKEIDRVKQIRKFADQQNAVWPEISAKRIPVVPKELTEEILRRDFRCKSDSEKLVVGLDYATVAPAVLFWDTQNILAFCGKKELGRIAFTDYMIRHLNQDGARIYILDDFSGELEKYGKMSGVELYSKTAGDVKEMLHDMRQTLEDRYQRILAGEKDFLRKEPLLVLLICNPEVPAVISNDRTVLAVYKDILGKYRNLKSCIIYTHLESAEIGFNAPEAIKVMKDNRQFLIFENINDIRPEMPLQLKKKFARPLESGELYMLRENTLMKLKAVQPKGN